MIDRSEVNRALAKAIAYKQCGKDRHAKVWAAELVRLLDVAEFWTLVISATFIARGRLPTANRGGDEMNKLSVQAKAALMAAYATRGKHRGQLLARCPDSRTLAAAAWQGAMLVCNPYKASIGAMLFMNDEQRAIMQEITAHFEALPREYMKMAQRDRYALETLGVW